MADRVGRVFSNLLLIWLLASHLKNTALIIFAAMLPFKETLAASIFWQENMKKSSVWETIWTVSPIT